MIRVFEGVFAGDVQRDQQVWDLKRNAVDARLTSEYQRWEPIIGVNVDE